MSLRIGLIGGAVGILLMGMSVTHSNMSSAQSTPMAKGYLIVEHGVPTPELMADLENYNKVAGSLMTKYEGRFIVADSENIQPLEGDWTPPFVAVLEFPSYEQARAFYYSDEYQAVLPERFDVFKKSRGILVRGLPGG